MGEYWVDPKIERPEYPTEPPDHFLPVPEDDRSLVEVVEELECVLQADRSTTCPACQQTVALYRRSIYGSMARWLIWLVRVFRREGGEGWFHWRDRGAPKLDGGDFAKMEAWGLIRPYPHNDDPSKRTSGYWCPERWGCQYGRGFVEVPKVGVFYNGVCRYFSEEKGDIRVALGKKFDFREIMGKDAEAEPFYGYPDEEADEG